MSRRMEGPKDGRVQKGGRAEGWKGSRFELSKDGVDGREDGRKVGRKGGEGRDGRQNGKTGGKEAKIERMERESLRQGQAKKAKAGRKHVNEKA